MHPSYLLCCLLDTHIHSIEERLRCMFSASCIIKLTMTLGRRMGLVVDKFPAIPTVLFSYTKLAKAKACYLFLCGYLASFYVCVFNYLDCCFGSWELISNSITFHSGVSKILGCRNAEQLELSFSQHLVE